ncbi:PadR family transcriptional regulator [Clostridium sardiniense]|uniref:PadR family transcriptional regulator n=1 Tax=Clostridium sardiniense TaxID=29369 RepID=A0ABS7KXC5_CLOSR|nr:PadR family transcriptional regulator [Clostridium sardiniense]MBY0755307.1 PadR family transcriptional regulator [Clostridium sardiniense]MDQ0459752.1 DNA-binding PadR family transcriptional regulator [Clostridium sardiniense]
MARKKALEEDILTDSTYYILLTLVRPMHGYGIMQEIKELSNNKIDIGPASLYTILKKLQDGELIKLLDDNGDRRKTYILTDKGKELIKKDIERRRLMVSYGEKALKILEG